MNELSEFQQQHVTMKDLLYQVATMPNWFDRSDTGVCFCKYCEGSNYNTRTDQPEIYIHHKSGCLWLALRRFFHLPVKIIVYQKSESQPTSRHVLPPMPMTPGKIG